MVLAVFKGALRLLLWLNAQAKYFVTETSKSLSLSLSLSLGNRFGFKIDTVYFWRQRQFFTTFDSEDATLQSGSDVKKGHPLANAELDTLFKQPNFCKDILIGSW